MKITNMLKVGVLCCAALINFNTHAKMVEYYEDAYAHQAPQEVAEQVARIADKIGFAKDFEVIVPKKPGVQINPANKMITYGINPQTKNPFMIINTEWFSTLSKDQQDFLIARSLATLENSGWNTLPKLFTPLWLIIFFALGMLAFFVLKRKYLVGKPTWMILLATLIPLFIVDTALGPVHNKMNVNIAQRYNAQMARLALEKTGLDKQVAIDTFIKMDDFVKKELADGDTFWKSLENTFANIADRLK